MSLYKGHMEDSSGNLLLPIPPDVAPIQLNNTASQAFAVGDYFWHNNSLYRCTASISSGGSFVPNTNCVAVTVGEELKRVSAGENITSQITQSGSNQYSEYITSVISPNNAVYVINGVCYVNGYFHTFRQIAAPTASNSNYFFTGFPIPVSGQDVVVTLYKYNGNTDAIAGVDYAVIAGNYHGSMFAATQLENQISNAYRYCMNFSYKIR